MDKRYQVFVSSTFADLKDERSNVIQTLMEMDCIPAGMELFPALDEEQFEFIKKVIDDSDYYLLIVGGRYGSLSDEGVSYTEMEYDYAISKGIKVIALVHGSPEKLAVEKVEMDSEARQKLQIFREKVTTNRLVKFWDDAKELSGLVALSLPKTIKTYPAVGWVRGNEATDNTDLLKQLNELRQDKDKLEKQVQELEKNKSDKLDLAQDEDFTDIRIYISNTSTAWNETITWREIFRIIGPMILVSCAESEIFAGLAKEILFKEDNKQYLETIPNDTSMFSTALYSAYIEKSEKHKIKFQLLNLGYIQILSNSRKDILWNITDEGQKYLLKIMSIKRDSEVSDE